MIAPATKTLGFRSAVVATACALTYVVAQIAEWLGWMGSAGGAESRSTPIGLFVLLTPSLVLGPAFVVLIACLHEITTRDRRIFGAIALAFATIYCALIAINYFVQLAWVAPRLAAGEEQGLEPFVFTPFDSFLYAVDILGYSFMSLSALFAARTLPGPGPARIARWSLTATGLLLPFLVFQMYIHDLIWIAALWAITFPAATWSLALFFRRAV